jgi:Xaa-Pro aminopeptidase
MHCSALLSIHISQYLFHQNTDLAYLTGCTEPGSALVLDTTIQAQKADTESCVGQVMLFVQPRNTDIEQWHGPMIGVSDETRDRFGVDAVHACNELSRVLEDRVAPSNWAGSPCTAVFVNENGSSVLSRALSDMTPNGAKALLKRLAVDIDAKLLVSTARLTKTECEIELLRAAASAIAGGLNDAMANTVLDDTYLADGTPCIPERIIEAHIEFGAKTRGASRLSFPSVVASGRNSTVLHYMKNGDVAIDGDFVMVDAGCQVSSDGPMQTSYCSDVSRSWPVSGKFTSEQRAIYELVLGVQLQCIDLSREGATYRGRPVSLNTLHCVSVEELTRGLHNLGFFRGMSAEEAMRTGAYSRYYNHSIGHYLGCDVHDTHNVSKDLPLTRGMVITVEPGLYIQHEDEMAPAEFHGLGLRIEDDVVITPEAREPEVISAEAVKSIADVESLVGSAERSRRFHAGVGLEVA